MKKIICFVLVTSLLLSVLCACGEKHTSAADAYLDIAQGYVDEGDYAAAVSTLEKGYKATGDSRIAVMMADLAVQADGAAETETTEEPSVEPTQLPTESQTEPIPTESEDPGQESDSPYVGKWQDTWSQRATITINPDYAGYYVLISWANSASEVLKWEMTAKDAEGDSLFSNNCKHWIEYCDEAGNITETVIYTGGQVTLGIFDGVLHWFDYTQEAGENCRFEKVGSEQQVPSEPKPSSESKIFLEDYHFTWVPKSGGLPFDISVNIDKMGDMGSLCTVYYIMIYSESGVHEIMGDFGTEVLTGNTFEENYTDFCDHSGKMTLIFNNDTIILRLQQVGIPDVGEIVLIRE